MTRSAADECSRARTARIRVVLALVLFGVVGWSPVPAAAAQDSARAEREEVDPYTEGDPEALEALGIRRFGPFRFGDGRTTEVIAEASGDVPFLWVETEHFQIGLSLEPQEQPGEPDEKKALKAELTELRSKWKGFPRKARELDPWLLLHLYAQRLETLYDAFVERMGLEEYAAENPYLGTGGPICILVTEKRSSLARFTQASCSYRAEHSLRYFFDEPADQVFFGITYESLEGDLHTGNALHFAVVHGTTQILATAVRGYYGEPPVWFTAGLGHWFARDLVDDEILLFMTPSNEQTRGEEDADFEPKIRGRVKNGATLSLERMLGWTDAGILRFPENMQAWSKVDFLMRADGGSRARAALWALSEPIEWGIPDREAVVAAQMARTFADVGDGSLEALDAAWADWVLDTYRKR